jgi:hypothetical protein
VPQYIGRLLPPPLEGLTLRVQGLPCADQWWWEDIPSAPLDCTTETGVCRTALTAPDGWDGIWLRSFFVRVTPGNPEPLVEQSLTSNVVKYGTCLGDAPPQPVPEPGLVSGLLIVIVVLATLRSIRELLCRVNNSRS